MNHQLSQMHWEPKDKAYAARVRASFGRQPFMKVLHAELINVSPGFCEIHIPYNIALTQQHSFLHAGVVSTLADNTAGYAAFTLMEASSSVLTVEFKINLVAPAMGACLIGRSNVLKYGRTLTVTRSDVFVVKDGVEKLCAVSQSTLIELRNKMDHQDIVQQF